jgi:hypothetical protein
MTADRDVVFLERIGANVESHRVPDIDQPTFLMLGLRRVCLRSAVNWIERASGVFRDLSASSVWIARHTTAMREDKRLSRMRSTELVNIRFASLSRGTRSSSC